VDAESAPLNNPLDLGQPKLRGIILFQGTASDESEVMDAEDNRVEDRSMAWIKWTIDGDVATS
jgi:hypothetical protein